MMHTLGHLGMNTPSFLLSQLNTTGLLMAPPVRSWSSKLLTPEDLTIKKKPMQSHFELVGQPDT